MQCFSRCLDNIPVISDTFAKSSLLPAKYLTSKWKSIAIRSSSTMASISFPNLPNLLFAEWREQKISSKFIEQPYRSVISVKLLCKCIEITLWHGCSPVNLLHIFRTPSPRNTSEWLLLREHVPRLIKSLAL